MDFLKALWRGEVALVKTYWLYGVVGGWVISIPTFFLDDLDYELIDPVLLIGLSIYFLFWIAYLVFISVSIWRSANKYQGNQWWARFAQASVIIGVFKTISDFYLEGL